MRPRYTIHARERMIERNLTEQDIEYVVANYHTMYHDRKGNPNYVGAIGDRRVRVVVAVGTHPLLIITVIVAEVGG